MQWKKAFGSIEVLWKVLIYDAKWDFIQIKQKRTFTFKNILLTLSIPPPEYSAFFKRSNQVVFISLVTILTVIIIQFQQYTVHHSYTHNFSRTQTYFTQLIYFIHFRYRIRRIKRPSWLDLSHPIMSHMSYVILLFRNLYRVIKCECYYCVFREKLPCYLHDKNVSEKYYTKSSVS